MEANIRAAIAAPPFEGVLLPVRDADIDTLTTDGAQDTTRWADAVAAVTEAMAILESTKRDAALVGGPAVRPARARWNSLVGMPAEVLRLT